MIYKDCSFIEKDDLQNKMNKIIAPLALNKDFKITECKMFRDTEGEDHLVVESKGLNLDQIKVVYNNAMPEYDDMMVRYKNYMTMRKRFLFKKYESLVTVISYLQSLKEWSDLDLLSATILILEKVKW